MTLTVTAPPDFTLAASPTLLTVKRGQSVRITLEDLTAIDPDSPAQSLAFAVSSATMESMWLSGEMHSDSVPPAISQSFAACGTS